MSSAGARDLSVLTRAALLDALEALAEHRNAVVIIGAQAIYLHTGGVDVALAESTKDSDIALDPRQLSGDPLIEKAMAAAGFSLDSSSQQPGSWISPHGIPVDLMVPHALTDPGGRRGARIPPHSAKAARKAAGLEAAIVDRAPMEIMSLEESDPRRFMVSVAGPAGLLVAKLHKLGERQASPHRLQDKDAHDIYRLLVAIPTEDLSVTTSQLLADSLAGLVTAKALDYLREMFAAGPQATGSLMAGRAEEGIGNPETVSASVAFLAADLLSDLHR